MLASSGAKPMNMRVPLTGMMAIGVAFDGARPCLHRTKMLLTTVAIGCGIALAGAAIEQPYPNRTIKLVVPYVAGGPTDIVARAIAEKLAISLRQPIVTENRPGAGGNIGTEAVAKAPPDGHTLGLLINTTLTVNPSVYKTLPFDPDKDIRPISIVTTTRQMLVVHPTVPVRSVAEFVAYAKAATARKEPLTYASAGNGTPSHLAMEYFRLHATARWFRSDSRPISKRCADGRRPPGRTGQARLRRRCRHGGSHP
jgi:tripartite-type tricarboxylate transporter receptor subunit TctC